jgi:hypothetical protein
VPRDPDPREPGIGSITEPVRPSPPENGIFARNVISFPSGFRPGAGTRMFLCVGLEDIYEFRLVADTGQPPISTDEWLLLRRLLVHMQPARSAALEGDPPRSILVHGYGGIEVATGLLRSLERFAQTTLHVEVEASVSRRAGALRLPLSPSEPAS